MERRFLLDVIVIKGASILKLLSSKDQTLLVGGDPTKKIIKVITESLNGCLPLLVLNFGFDIVNSVRGLYFQRNCFAREAIAQDSMSDAS